MTSAVQGCTEHRMSALHKGRLIPWAEFPMEHPLLKVQRRVMHSGREACLIFLTELEKWPQLLGSGQACVSRELVSAIVVLRSRSAPEYRLGRTQSCTFLSFCSMFHDG